MTFFEAIQSGLSQYANFQGRARRSEYWWFVLFSVLLSMAANAIDATMPRPVLGALVSLGLFLPNLALQVRRLHDTDRSGWWVLISAVPLVGLILLIVWWCQDGTLGENRFGRDPKPGRAAFAAFTAPPPSARVS